ncbi:unnamed protein product [Microthlaspi erraticum]|uniref:Uncharacterized protein n=1 Tax=Microthlaspi erraticum TaxID=1685480 RepID=A0A6D2K5C4_9BRAS|nr:unnamed protein product [Microthlaspi erraticum]
MGDLSRSPLRNRVNQLDSVFEFPYEFDSPAFSPGFTSLGYSTETEDESSDDEEVFLASLTCRLTPSTQDALYFSFFFTMQLGSDPHPAQDDGFWICIF